MRANEMRFSTLQLIVLVLFRLLIGYHFLYLGLEKLFNPDWTSAGFLLQTNALFAGIYHEFAASATAITVIDYLNIWGQILIGAGLIAGACTRTASWSAAVLLLLYYTALPPFLQGNLFIDRNMMEFFALLVLALFPTGHLIGIDYFFTKKRMSENG